MISEIPDTSDKPDYDSADKACRTIIDANTDCGAMEHHEPEIIEGNSGNFSAFFRQMDLIEDKLEEEFCIETCNTPIRYFIVGELDAGAAHRLPWSVLNHMRDENCAYSHDVRENFQAYFGSKLKNCKNPVYFITSKKEYGRKLRKLRPKTID